MTLVAESAPQTEMGPTPTSGSTAARDTTSVSSGSNSVTARSPGGDGSSSNAVRQRQDLQLPASPGSAASEDDSDSLFPTIPTSLADLAAYIPGFDLLTLVIGANPLSGEPVEPTAENILGGLVGLAPGGALVYGAVSDMGIVERWSGPRARPARRLRPRPRKVRTCCDRDVGRDRRPGARARHHRQGHRHRPIQFRAAGRRRPGLRRLVDRRDHRSRQGSGGRLRGGHRRRQPDVGGPEEDHPLRPADGRAGRGTDGRDPGRGAHRTGQADRARADAGPGDVGADRPVARHPVRNLRLAARRADRSGGRRMGGHRAGQPAQPGRRSRGSDRAGAQLLQPGRRVRLDAGHHGAGVHQGRAFGMAQLGGQPDTRVPSSDGHPGEEPVHR